VIFEFQPKRPRPGAGSVGECAFEVFVPDLERLSPEGGISDAKSVQNKAATRTKELSSTNMDLSAYQITDHLSDKARARVFIVDSEINMWGDMNVGSISEDRYRDVRSARGIRDRAVKNRSTEVIIFMINPTESGHWSLFAVFNPNSTSPNPFHFDSYPGIHDTDHVAAVVKNFVYSLLRRHGPERDWDAVERSFDANLACNQRRLRQNQQKDGYACGHFTLEIIRRIAKVAETAPAGDGFVTAVFGALYEDSERTKPAFGQADIDKKRRDEHALYQQLARRWKMTQAARNNRALDDNEIIACAGDDGDDENGFADSAAGAGDDDGGSVTSIISDDDDGGGDGDGGDGDYLPGHTYATLKRKSRFDLTGSDDEDGEKMEITSASDGGATKAASGAVGRRTKIKTEPRAPRGGDGTADAAAPHEDAAGTGLQSKMFMLMRAAQANLSHAQGGGRHSTTARKSR